MVGFKFDFFLPVHLYRSEHVAAEVRSAMVVNTNALGSSLHCFVDVAYGLRQSELIFKNAIHPFSNSVFIRIAILGHADTDAISFQVICI